MDSTDFKFTCSVPYPPAKNDAIFYVTWTVDGKQLPASVTLTGSQRTAILYGEDLEGYLGGDLTCRVVSRFADNHTNRTSPTFVSNKYWVGFKVNILIPAILTN